jgi:Holliday junction resolvase RusA-like endonuclease
MDQQPILPPMLWERTFQVPGEPQAWMRAAPDRGGIMRDPRENRQAKRVIMAASMGSLPPARHEKGPITVGMTFFMGIPPSWAAWEKDEARRGMILPTGTPDLDNLIKLVLDALKRSGWWFRDDAQVAGFHARPFKLYSDKPGSIIQVRALAPPTRPPLA